MGRKSKTRQLTDGILGQHLALSVAAHLARTQLVPDPLNVYDAQHMSDMLDAVADALARVAPLYVRDGSNGKEPRQLMESELEGACVKRGATVLVLNDGRTHSVVSVKRDDLRQAIALLKAVGIPQLAGLQKPPESSRPQRPDRFAQLRAQMAEIDKLLTPPFVQAQLERASSLMVSIARGAPQGRLSNMAMRLMSAVHDARARQVSDDDRVRTLLARLHAALDEAAEKAAR